MFFWGLKDEARVFLLQVVSVGISQDNLSYKYCNCKYTHLDPALPVPNGWEKVPFNNPAGLKHHLLEGAGRYTLDLLYP